MHARGGDGGGGDDGERNNYNVFRLVKQAKPLALAQGVEIIVREQRLGQLARSQSALQAFLCADA
jgi:hypothetical protein